MYMYIYICVSFFNYRKARQKSLKRTFSCLIYAMVNNKNKMNEKQQKPHSVFAFGQLFQYIRFRPRIFISVHP